MKGDEIRECLSEAVKAGAFPGAAFAVGGPDEFTCGWVGRQRFDEGSPSIDESTIWDLASLTKVIATTPVFMRLVQGREVDLDAPAKTYIPELKHGFTIRDLLKHRSGLAPYYEFWRDSGGREAAEVRLLSLGLEYETGSQTVYSCLGFLILKLVAERVTGQPFEVLVEDFVTAPLGLASTAFLPPLEIRPSIAPTERRPSWREGDCEFLQGEVHDPAAYVMGGVSGNAGLFANAMDVAAFAQAWLNPGALWSGEFIKQFSASEEDRALGWAKWSPGGSGGEGCSSLAFGHTGFTGTSIWIDPESQRFGVLLTNRVHPTADNQQIAGVRQRFHTLAWEL